MKLCSLVTAVASLMLGLSGAVCRADVTILGWPGGPEEKALNALVEKYNDTQGKIDHSRVKTVYFGRDEFFDRESRELTTGSKGIDLTLLVTYNVGRYAAYVDPLPDDVTESMGKIFPQAVLKTQQYEGKQYGVPTDMGLHFVYYRKDLMQQLLTDAHWKTTYTQIAQRYLGKPLVPKDPQQWDWDDFLACTLFFTRSINAQSPVQFGTALQLKNLLFNIMLWQNTVHSFGGDWRSGNTITVQSEAYTKGLQIYKFIVDHNGTPADSTTYEYAQANTAFGNGSVAFMLQWSAAYDELMDAGKYPLVADQFYVAPPPKGSKSRGTYVHTLGLGINKASVNKTDAVHFLKWLVLPDTIRFYIEKGGRAPMKTEFMHGVAKPDLLKMAEYAGWYGYVMNGGNTANALKIYELQASEFSAYWSGHKTAEQAQAAVQARMKDLLK